VFTLEAVAVLLGTTPNFGWAAGMQATGGVTRAVIEAAGTTAEAVVTGETAASFATGSFTLGQIVHLVAASDGTHTQLYENGVAVGSPIAVTPPAAANLTGSFGNLSGSAQWCHCETGFMRWYAATCLTGAQVAKNYAHAKTLFPALP